METLFTETLQIIQKIKFVSLQNKGFNFFMSFKSKELENFLGLNILLNVIPVNLAVY